jgi:hypothetical protein
MKVKGRTGKGCYREYYGAPKWFLRRFSVDVNGSMFNVAYCKHYIGRGFNRENHDWTDGVFLTDFEYGLSWWEKDIKDADFIIHFREAV